LSDIFRIYRDNKKKRLDSKSCKRCKEVKDVKKKSMVSHEVSSSKHPFWWLVALSSPGDSGSCWCGHSGYPFFLLRITNKHQQTSMMYTCIHSTHGRDE
jgi:hypothetical protein